jgi:hypothetical protein
VSDADHVRETMERCRAGLERWRRYVREVEEGDAGRELVEAQVEHERRRGVPVVRGHMHAGVIVMDIATPKGNG